MKRMYIYGKWVEAKSSEKGRLSILLIKKSLKRFRRAGKILKKQFKRQEVLLMKGFGVASRRRKEEIFFIKLLKK